MFPGLACILLATANLSIHPAVAERVELPSERAKRILRTVDDLWRGQSSHGILSMQVQTAHYTRSMRLEGWSKGKELSLVRIVAPLKEKGTATLKSGTSIYTYLPQTDRTIRLTSGMMMGSWMGSHFTNDDLVKESRLEDDYDPAITFEGERDGQSVLEFTLLPKPQAAVVWGKVVITVRAADYIPVSSLYYDEDMTLVRTMTFSTVKEMGGRRIPTVLRVVPADKPGESTELVYEQISFNLRLDDAVFSLAELRRK
jgi:hypothetical protein